jgi:uncharacterized membrane protein
VSKGHAGGLPAPSAQAPRTLVERFVERLLAAQIGLSVALMLLGADLGLAAGERLHSGVVVTSELPGALLRWEPAAFLSLGLIVLVATPFVRVAGYLAVYALGRDRRYVLVTAIVLAIMCIGVLLGRA